MSLVIVGSMAFDTIETPEDRKEKIIGGSCSYAALAASYFTSPKIVAVIGRDFPQDFIDLLNARGVDTLGLRREAGKTFHWEGRYGDDPNLRTTIRTELNVFQDFRPDLLPEYRKAELLFLGNIDPDLQENIRLQADSPKIVAMDTIQLWIDSKPDVLKNVLSRVDVFFGNDEEVKKIAGEKNLIRAGKLLLERGPSLMVIKKGEHGVLLMKKDLVFSLPAYPCESVVDPTGAGDSFAGGFLGYLDRAGSWDEANLRRAAVYGSVLASFTIDDFGVGRLQDLTDEEIAERYERFRKLVSF